MDARELLKQGKLAEAIAAVTQAVKSAPGDVPARTFLFELLSAAGEWERAQKHLDVVADRSTPTGTDGVGSYRALLGAEQTRSRLFAAGEGAPRQVTTEPLDPEPSLSALRRLRAGDHAEARRLCDAAEERRPARPGTVDGVPVGDFRDADDVLAPFLEVLASGLYGWIPFADIQKLEFEEPRFLRDLLWRPVAITLANGATATMFTPVRYALTEQADDPQVRLGRSTDWRDDGGIVTGIGQHAFVAGDEVRYVLDVREVVFEA